MCDFGDRLVAWLDHELPENEAADLQLHLQECVECRSRVETYTEVNKAIAEYCDAAVDSQTRRARPSWTPALFVAAAGVALLLLYPSARIEPPAPQGLTSQAPAMALSTDVAQPNAVQPQERASLFSPPAPRDKRAHNAKLAEPRRAEIVNWVPAELAVPIAIPASAMFAPGAVPDGISFTAELTIATDGSARQLRLRP
jgi:anti-sigma factor RsiW